MVFRQDNWNGEGGGRSRVMRDGAVFEQGGVGFSEVCSIYHPQCNAQRQLGMNGYGYLDGVASPQSLRANCPSLNYRYFEAGQSGGMAQI